MSSNITANWSYPTAVKLGRGRIKELADACKSLGMKKPLLVTDAGLANLPVTQNTVKLLKDAGIDVGVFSDVKPNPIAANVNAGRWTPTPDQIAEKDLSLQTRVQSRRQPARAASVVRALTRT